MYYYYNIHKKTYLISLSIDHHRHIAAYNSNKADNNKYKLYDILLERKCENAIQAQNTRARASICTSGRIGGEWKTWWQIHGPSPRHCLCDGENCCRMEWNGVARVNAVSFAIGRPLHRYARRPPPRSHILIHPSSGSNKCEDENMLSELVALSSSQRTGGHLFVMYGCFFGCRGVHTQRSAGSQATM